MARKMVTGDETNIVVSQKREVVELPCQGCGEPVKVMTPHSGDVLCDKCIKGKSYTLKSE